LSSPTAASVRPPDATPSFRQHHHRRLVATFCCWWKWGTLILSTTSVDNSRVVPCSVRVWQETVGLAGLNLCCTPDWNLNQLLPSFLGRSRPSFCQQSSVCEFLAGESQLGVACCNLRCMPDCYSRQKQTLVLSTIFSLRVFGGRVVAGRCLLQPPLHARLLFQAEADPRFVNNLQSARFWCWSRSWALPAATSVACQTAILGRSRPSFCQQSSVCAFLAGESQLGVACCNLRCMPDCCSRQTLVLSTIFSPRVFGRRVVAGRRLLQPPLHARLLF
jgi:hypothetical protein